MYPRIGIGFELTLIKDHVKNFSEYWKYNGKIGEEIPETLTVKLVQIGSCSDLNEARQRLGKLIPSGLFLWPFKAKYPEPDGNGPVGIADASWVHPLGHAGFPYVSTYGDMNFLWTVRDLHERWRWLVLVNGTSGT